jgi:NAD(P)-dependent dehydrogenase (short-subunit alcohol dehydrogenase family)
MTGILIDLSGTVALVTGGGSGVGAAAAAELARAGASVVAVGRRRERLNDVCGAIGREGGSAYPLVWDIGSGNDADELVAAAADRFGRLDHLVHAAGNQIRTPALDFALSDWDAVLSLHLRAAFALARATGRHLVKRASPGTCCFIGSMTSSRLGLADTVAYASAKSGLLGLTRTLAVEWGKLGIRVNTIAVGFVATAMTKDVDDEPARRALVARVPLGRPCTPAEIGRVVTFLASDLASYITGEMLSVDGGWSVA